MKWHESNVHSFNRYAYSGNNPYTNIDVDGDLFLSFHLNRRDMRTDHAMIAGQVGNVSAKTAMGLHSAGSAVGLVRGLSRSSVKMTLKGAEAAKSTLPKHTKHSLNQKINGQIKTSDELDAIRTPLVKMPVKFDSKGRPSQRSIGKKAEVAVNPDTKKIVSVNPTSSKKAGRLKRRKE